MPYVYSASSPWSQTNWNGGSGQTSWSDATKYSAGSSITDSTAGQLTLSPTSSWYNISWKKRKQITISSLMVSTSNQSNFPVLIYEASDANIASNAQADGDDIVITSSDGTTKLSHEIEKYTSSTGELWLWVKVPTLSASSNTTLYLYYGNASASSQQDATNVWDSNYKGVWHMPNGTTLSANDSTSNANNGTITGTTAGTGQVDGAGSFDGNDYIDTASEVSFSNTTSFTFEAWFKTNSITGAPLIVDRTSATNELINLYLSGDDLIFRIRDDNAQGLNSVTAANVLSTGTWYYGVGVRNVSTDTLELYLNAVSQGTVTDTTLTTISPILKFGSHSDLGLSYFWNGIIDEVRISSTARSASWIATEYNNQSSPATYETFASEEERYASSGTLTSSIFDTEQLSDWGTLTYNTDGVATTTVKARTSNSSIMVGATDFASCNAVTSGTDISSNNCVTDRQRYVQYQVSLTSVSANTPTFQDISIAFSASDISPPSISLTALSPDPNNDNTPSLSGTATDAAGTVSNVQFQMDSTSGSWTACTADDGSFNSATEAFTCNVSTALSDGSHTMYIRATDSNSNTTSDLNASTDTFTIDTTAPSIPGASTTTSPTNNNKPAWTWTASTDSGVGLSLTVPYSIQWCGNSLFTSCASSTATSTANSYTHLTALTDGTWYFKVKATDAVNNSSSYSSNGSVVVDTAAPSISVTALTPDPTNDNTPTISGTATDATTVLTAIQFQVDATSGSWATCIANDGAVDETAETFTCTTGTLTDGSHTIYVRTTDSASNTTALANYGTDIFTVDVTAPSVTLTALSPDPTTDTTPTITGTATDATTALASIQFQVDATAGSWSNCIAEDGVTNETTETFNCTAAALADGAHIIYVRATDNLGNVSGNSSDTFTVDTSVPATNSTPTTDTAPTANTATPAVDTAAPTLTLTKLGSLIFNSRYQHWYITNLKPTFKGQSSEAGTVTITIDKKGFNTGIWGGYGNFASANVLTESDGSFAWRAALEYGEYQVSLQAKDQAGNRSAKLTFYLIVDTYDNLVSRGIIAPVVVPEQSPSPSFGRPNEPASTVPDEESAEIVEEPGTALEGGPLASKPPSLLDSWISAFAGMTKSVAGVAKKIGQGIGKGAQTVGHGFAWGLTKTGDGMIWTATGIGRGVAWIGRGVGHGLVWVGRGAAVGLESAGSAIGRGYNNLARNATGTTQEVLITIGDGVSTVGQSIGRTGQVIGHGVSAAGRGAATIFNAAVNGTKDGVAGLAFNIGQKTQDSSETVGLALVKFGYLFVNEPTTISNVKITRLSPTAATVSWTTNHPANGKVNYGFTADYGQDVQSSKRVTEHRFTITNLEPNTTYYYEVMSQNKNYVYDANHTFITPKE